MRRSWLHRALAAPLALWFALAAVDLGGLHDCAVHGAPGGGHAHVAALRHHHGVTTPSAAPSRGEHDRSSQEVCTCPSACCGPTPTTGIAAAATLAMATWPPTGSLPLADEWAAPPGSTQVALPPAIGPPSLHG